VVLLHYRVVPGLGATPPPATPVSRPVTFSDPDPDPAMQAEVEDPCDCPQLASALSISVAA